MIHKMTNVFGGETIYQNGQMMGMSKPNILGGETFMDASGSIVGHSSENIIGGVDIYDAQGSASGHTSENILGGSNIYDGTGSFEGFTTQVGDMTTLFNDAGGVEAIVSGGAEILADLDLDPDMLIETMTLF